MPLRILNPSTNQYSTPKGNYSGIGDYLNRKNQEEQYADVNPKTTSGFGTWIKRQFEPENYATRILPILAAAEVISTRGKSQGENMLNQQDIILRNVEKNKLQANKQREQDAENYNKALERKLYGEIGQEDATSPEGLKKISNALIGAGKLKEAGDFLKQYAELTKQPPTPLTQEEMDYLKTVQPFEQTYATTDPQAWRKTRTGAQFRPTYETPDANEQRQIEEEKRNLAADKELAAYRAMLESKQKEKEQADPVKKASIERQSAIDLIDDIRSDPAAATGLDAARIAQLVPGTAGYTWLQKVENLKNRIALSERAKLKGGGQISDFEQKMLQKAATVLNPNLQRSAFNNELDRLRQVITDMNDSDSLQQPMVPARPAAPQPQGNRAANNPAIGEIRKGYRYIGGNPSSPNSWERVQ